MSRASRIACAFLVALFAGGCGAGEDRVSAAADPAADGTEVAVTDQPQDAFFANLAALCGRAFRGEAELASGSDFEEEMIMHVRRCSTDEIQIPLHVGENRSRTWIITRTGEGLRLKHDHRLEDGSDDPVTQYGGDTGSAGTATEQSFPADSFTAELLPEAATNVWTITLTEDQKLRYHLTRNGEPRATFVIDLTDEVEAPPAPWGYEGS